MSTAKLVKWFVWQTVRVEPDSVFTSLTPLFAHKLWCTQKKKLCYRILQSDNCASFKTNKTAHWNGLYPQFQSTSLYTRSYVLTCKSDHFSCAFDVTKIRKRRYYQITWNGRRNAISPLLDIPIGALFFGVLHFLQIWARKYPLKTVYVSGFVGGEAFVIVM